MEKLLRELIEALAAGRPCALAVVVETRGSTPQKAGAAMLFSPDGSQSGTLGGGCVEAEVRRRVLADFSRARSEAMSFTLDHDYGWDDGLICGGRMCILVEWLIGADAKAAEAYYARFAEALAAGRGCVESLAIADLPSMPLGAHVLFGPRGEVLGTLRGEPTAALAAAVPDLRRRPRASLKDGIAWLPHWPRVRLIIVGAGHVGQAVADLAAQAGFDVWVLDDREAYANAERFPRGQRLVVGAIDVSLQLLKQQNAFDANTFAIIVTRGHQHDEEALHLLADVDCGYLGMIGSRRKIRLIMEDLEGKGVPKEALARVHAPLGVQIGSQTVPEIAVSIVAELIACRNLGHVPPQLRQRQEPRGEE